MAIDRTRASDSERERVAGLLRDAAAEGRLTVEELDERCARAWAAVTRGELAALLDDLPVARWPAPSASPPPSPPRDYHPPPVPNLGPRPWMPGVLPFTMRWTGPPNPRAAGEWVLANVVPLFTAAEYEIVGRTSHQLELEREASGLAAVAALAGITTIARVTITMRLRADHSVTEVHGTAPQDVRQALAELNR